MMLDEVIFRSLFFCLGAGNCVKYLILVSIFLLNYLNTRKRVMKRLFSKLFSILLLVIPCTLLADSDQSECEKFPDYFIENRVPKKDKNKSEKSLKKRTLLITGCARSGTTFVSKFFELNGYDVQHEHDGLFGVVSWTMTPDSDVTPWGPAFNNYTFEHIFHQVRHPLKTIASAGNEPSVSWAFVKKFVPEIEMDDPKIVKGAKYWYYWNLLAEKKAEWTYRIEDIENQIGEMVTLLGVDLDPMILNDISTDINTRRYKDVYSWEDLKEALDETLFYNIVEMASRYGYDISETSCE